MHDDSALREQLLEAQMRFELGDISHDEFTALERDLLARIRAVKGARQGAISMSGRKRKSDGVEVEAYDV
jgi:hypothetical protein